ncbi:hypothetical protein K1719_033270 [Acacia pycnantha]|nr:hypothetical protein K1719_033270 [Acacia pycnantha]
MSVRGLKEPIVPLIFAATLKGALKWLHTLPFGSIHNFEDWPRPLSCTSRLANGNQNPKILSPKSTVAGEPLQSYLDRFNHAASQCADLTKTYTFTYWWTASIKSPAWRNLFKGAGKESQRLHIPFKEVLGRRAMRMANNPIRGGTKIEPPPIRIDQSKYCSFHDGRGHTTDECYELRDAIERFVREGKLQQYVIEHQGKGGKRKTKNRSRTPPRKFKKQEDKRKAPEADDEFPEAEFDCNVISGAMGGGGDTISQRRKYLREVLSVRDRPKFKEHHTEIARPPLFFTRDDLKDVVPGHQDGLVITGTVVNSRVKRIFVDAGDRQPRNRGYCESGIKESLDKCYFETVELGRRIFIAAPKKRLSGPFGRDSPDEEVNTWNWTSETMRFARTGRETGRSGDRRPLRTTKIGKHLSPELRSGLRTSKENKDVFAQDSSKKGKRWKFTSKNCLKPDLFGKYSIQPGYQMW